MKISIQINHNKFSSIIAILTGIIFLFGNIITPLYSQSVDQIMIGQDGVMRWRGDSSEVTGFGVNYTVPFAHAYRSGKKLNVDLKTAIDQDVYQFYRLGFDLFRVHVWDTEISDTLGNLLQNEHLDLFDYLLFKLQERGINAVITPIAYWGNGWPEPDQPSPGFSYKYGKDSCLVDPDAIRAQENYLRQFVNHVNKYTGSAYKDDPKILAFEVCNEPHHRGTPEEVTAFVSKMVNAIKSTGCTKPIFYNVTHSIHLADAYYNAGIDGGTFQWYPTGLGFQKELGGNMLPNVDRYIIPFEDVLKKNSSARFVYEFDAADMLSSYMYPAMARTFRTSGMQLATHFSYDPTFLAPYNTEYNTHYMNLVYAPRKALSLMICAEVFRNIPLYKDYGTYPDNAVFGPFRVNYEKELAEMVTDKKFIYTNHTTTKIPSPGTLELIAGWGNSTMIEYEGTGAYFLDRLGDAVWRLELMPDAIIHDNVFGQNNLETKRAATSFERHTMKINLPEFENGYAIQSMDWRDSVIYKEVPGGESMEIKPGIYMIMGPEYEQGNAIVLESNKPIRMDEYGAPGTTIVSDKNPYSSKRQRVKTIGGELVIFDPLNDHWWLNRQWVRDSKLFTDSSSNKSYLYTKLNGLVRRDVENPNSKGVGDYSMRHYFGDLANKNELISKTTITIEAYAHGFNSFPLQVALVMKDGSAFGTNIIIDQETKEHTIPLSDFGPVKTVLLPRPYPTFLPYYSVAGKSDELNMAEVESLQLSIGPGIMEKRLTDVYELMLGEVKLR
ncbi:MAG TPA: cellulase family glycosylhydrolase [Saprospiraceae bacterium]|nr:cellulase family glycosylhydrolase [Saprospiraceae bacterium]